MKANTDELRTQIGNVILGYHHAKLNNLETAEDEIMTLIQDHTDKAVLEELEGFMKLAEKRAFDTQMGGYPAVYHADIDNYCIPRIEALSKRELPNEPKKGE